MANKTIRYHDDLIESLRNPKERAAYINAALEEGNPKVLLKALRNVAESNGGMARLSSKTKLARGSLYRMLSQKGNPELASLGKILQCYGLKILVQPERATSGMR